MVVTVVGSIIAVFLLITFWTGRNVRADCHHHPGQTTCWNCQDD